MRAQIGRKTSSSGYFKPVLSGTPSIQGEWTEDLVVNDFDLVEGINTVNLDNLPEGNFFFTVGNKTFKIIKAAN